MWVWIPRYIYKISTGWHNSTAGTIEVQFSKGIDDNWNSSVIGNIDTGTTAESSNNKWTNHPAFDFGSTKLMGIWIAKFEASSVEGVTNGYTSDGSCATGDDVTTKTIKSIPNVASWRCINVGNAFTVVRNMEASLVYGWTTASGLQDDGSFTTNTNNIDTHLMKNSEWGAVSYLSKSQYGQNGDEIWINNSQTFITGCAGSTISEEAYNGCQNAYQSTNGVKASTTGNIYGIYDLSGGAWEYVAAYVDNANGNLEKGASITGALTTYKNIYTKGTTDDQASNYALAINQKGDATYETSSSYSGSNSWFSDYSNMAYNNYPWLGRGGGFSNGLGAGIFCLSSSWGETDSGFGFRPVLLVNAGL
jgi:hypothetical protein